MYLVLPKVLFSNLVFWETPPGSYGVTLPGKHLGNHRLEVVGCQVGVGLN